MEKLPHILMVEDEAAILKANSEYMQAQGYRVTAVGTLGEARAALEAGAPDLLLLDIMLPDGSGYDLCAEVRAKMDVPVIYLTALGDIQNEERGFALGGDDYIVKPYRMSILAARVAALLRRAGASTGRRLEIPPLSVDIRTGQCLLSGKRIKLSQMELRLLYFFMENYGVRISRERIYEAVWGGPPSDSVHTVKEHVYRLRKKLDMANPDSFFKIATEGPSYLFGKVRY